jgi:light-regulated signal transduction histidine kinase (bacteriophytochrome)
MSPATAPSTPTHADAAPAGAADLSRCDREPIHIPGSIQPHGLLLALEEPSLTVLQASANAEALLGVPPLGRTLGQILPPDAVEAVNAALRGPGLDGHALYLASFDLDSGRFDAVAHRHRGVLILELERAASPGGTSFQTLYSLVRGFVGGLQGAGSSLDIAGIAAEEVRTLTGFDRVMIYRFDEDWNGTVIAESRAGRLPSYLGLRFPASDIPRQARDLYRVNRLRLIPDAGYTPVPLEPPLNPRTGAPLDLTQSVLRSVSPVHVEYMRNMGTASSMSISILRAGELWGLISCHHPEPWQVPYEVRAACDFLGQVLSLQLEARERQEIFEHRVRLKTIQGTLLAAMSGEENFVDGLAAAESDLLALAGAAGAALVSGGRVRRVRAAPPEADVLRIADWLSTRGRRDVHWTDSLPQECPGLCDSAGCCGLLAISISQLHHSYLMWFRPELVRTVKWGGDPAKPAATDAAGRPAPPDAQGRIHPRRSFEVWKETVHQRSAPWLDHEVAACSELRSAIVGVVLRRAEEMAELSDELARSNKELEAFSYSVSHDLRAPFRHIVGFAELLKETHAERLDDTGRRYVDTIIDSAHCAGTLVDNLLSFSQMGRASLTVTSVDMDQLVREVRTDVMTEAPGRSVQWRIGHLPRVQGDAMMLKLVVRNLLSNAVKYSGSREQAQIEVACERLSSPAAPAEEFVFHVRDNGVGFDMKYADKLYGVFRRLHRAEEFPGTGIGLANVRRIVTRHGGRVWADSRLGEGSTFSFSLPVVSPLTSPPPHGAAD